MKNYICVFTKDVDNYNCNLQLRELKNSLGDSYVNKINEEFSLSRIDDCIKESLDMGFSNFILLSEQNQTETLTDALREEYGKYFEDIYSVGERFVRLKEDGQPGSQQDPDEGEDVVIQNNSEQDTGEDFLNDTTKQEKIDIVSDVTGLGFTGGLDTSSIRDITLGEIFGENKTDKELVDKYNTTLISFYVFGGESVDKEFYSKLNESLKNNKNRFFEEETTSGSNGSNPKVQNSRASQSNKKNYGKPLAFKNLDYDKFKKILVDNLGGGWESKRIWAENNYESVTSYNNANVITPLMLASLKALAEGKTLIIKDTNNTETNTQNAQNNKTDNQNTGGTETSQRTSPTTDQAYIDETSSDGDNGNTNESLDISNKNHLYENELVKSLKFLKKLKEDTSSKNENSSKQKTDFFFDGVLNTKGIKNACFGIDENFAPTRDCSIGLQSYYGESNYKSGLFEISKFAYNLLENYIKKESNWSARKVWCGSAGGTKKEEPIIFSEDALVCFGGTNYDELINRFSGNSQQGEPQKQSLKISSKNHLKEYSGSPNAGAQSQQQQQVHTQFFKNFGEDRIKDLNDLYSKYAKQVTNIETKKANKSVSSQKPMVTPNFDNSIKRRIGATLEPMGEITNNVGQKQTANRLIYNIKVLPSRFCSLKELTSEIGSIDSGNDNRFLVFEDSYTDDTNGSFITPSKFCRFLEDMSGISERNEGIFENGIDFNLLKNVYQSVYTDTQTKLPHTISSFLYSLPSRIASDVSGGNATQESVVSGLKNIGEIQIKIGGAGTISLDTNTVEKTLLDIITNSGNNFVKSNKVINTINEIKSFEGDKLVPFNFNVDKILSILQEKEKIQDIETLKSLLKDKEGTYQKLFLFLSQKCFLKYDTSKDDGNQFLSKFFSKEITEQYVFNSGNNEKALSVESFKKLKELLGTLSNSPFKPTGEYGPTISLLTSISTLKQTFKEENKKYENFVKNCQSKFGVWTNVKGALSDIGNILKDTGLSLLRDFGDALWNDPWSEWKNYWDEQLKGTLTGALVKNIGNMFGAFKDMAKAGIKNATNSIIGGLKDSYNKNKNIKKILSDEQLEMLKNIKKDGLLGLEDSEVAKSTDNTFIEKPLDEKSILSVLNTFKFLASKDIFTESVNLKKLGLVFEGKQASTYQTCSNNFKIVRGEMDKSPVYEETAENNDQGSDENAGGSGT